MILGILQARMSSTRLPGKVLARIIGRPMLELQLERLARSRRMDKLVVATSDMPEDDPMAALCAGLGVDCRRGSLDNVLDRFYQAARPYAPEHVVRLTGDCPLTDPGLIDALIEFYLEQNVAYVSNCNPPTLPDGMDAEIFRFSALEQAWREAELPSELEHVTPFIRNRPERFSQAAYLHELDLSRLRLTVDEPEDLEMVRRIYEHLYPGNSGFGLEDILVLLRERPELVALNSHIGRNEGARKSMVKDKEYLGLREGRSYGR